MQRSDRIVVIGAGIGGLVAALQLAQQGCEVTVVERATRVGGKMRTVDIAGHTLDVGPTVLTMRWVFDEIFAAAGASFGEAVKLTPLDLLARHAWGADERLDLFADIERSTDAIAAFAGPAEAARYVEFCKRAETTYETLKNSYILAPKPTPLSLTVGAGLRGLSDLWRISPFTTLWSALGEYFHDPRLRQLFGRYATYCGSSPFEAPATLMLVAHVEREGVWIVDGGIHKLAEALQNLAAKHAVAFRFGAEAKEILVCNGSISGIELTSTERIACEAVVVNADCAALANGTLGTTAAAAIKTPAGQRSLSALTWAVVAETNSFPLARHNVFFSKNYKAEFDDIFKRRRLPSQPTVYVCAEDRGADLAPPAGSERLFALVNAPPVGDVRHFDSTEIDSCRACAFDLLQKCGLIIKADWQTAVTATPNDFARLFPATGGALYGQASHGWTASFARPTAKTNIPGLYLAGGSVHPGPGVPMAAISGRLASAQILSDLRSTRTFHPTAMPGGTSTR